MLYPHLRRLKGIFICWVCTLLVIACSDSSLSVDMPPTEARVVSPLPSLTLTPRIPTATETARPSTVTPRPSATLQPSATTEPTPTIRFGDELEGEDLVAALQHGGYVIYFRHAQTEPTQTDTSIADFQDCSTQRNLTEAGRAQARAIGKAILSLDIPIGKVVSSAYCRTRETALLAFGDVAVSMDLTGFPTEQTQQRMTALRQMLAQAPAAGSNTVLVSHGLNIANTAGISLVEGEAAIFAPVEPDSFSLVARVPAEIWPELEDAWANLGGEGFAGNPNLLLPDLMALPPEDLVILSDAGTGQKQLRFTTAIQNNGPGNLEVWGYSDPTSAKTIVVQEVSTVDTVGKKVVVGEFVFHPEHDHWHLGDFARYEIWVLGPEGTLDERAAATEKVSYCLRDDAQAEDVSADQAQSFTGCNHQRQGITAGWIDIYSYELPGQSVDISALPDGVYVLLNIVDPDKFLWELDRENNSAGVIIEIEGDRVTVLE